MCGKREKGDWEGNGRKLGPLLMIDLLQVKKRAFEYLNFIFRISIFIKISE